MKARASISKYVTVSLPKISDQAQREDFLKCNYGLTVDALIFRLSEMKKIIHGYGDYVVAIAVPGEMSTPFVQVATPAICLNSHKWLGKMAIVLAWKHEDFDPLSKSFTKLDKAKALQKQFAPRRAKKSKK